MLDHELEIWTIPASQIMHEMAFRLIPRWMEGFERRAVMYRARGPDRKRSGGREDLHADRETVDGREG